MLLLLSVCWLVGCGAQSESDNDGNIAQLRQLVTELGIEPLQPQAKASVEKVELGRLLFFDPLLSGNKDQSCGTCHHPSKGSSDGRSLSVGTQAVRVDGVRIPGPDHTFTPRNALGLWDLAQRPLRGHRGAFWDRRVEAQAESFVLFDIGYDSSMVARLVLPESLESLVAAVAMLPVLDRDEMRGEVGETASDGSSNELARILDSDFAGIWSALMLRIVSVPEYLERFGRVYPTIEPNDLHFGHVANAIAAFIESEFQSVDTPWDRFVAGEDAALQARQARGALVFFGKGRCVDCHGSDLLGDDKVHNYAVRPMTTGPKSDEEDVDLGAGLRTNAGPDSRYAFRTPALRNVVETGPWMHNGSYTSLAAVIRHKRSPIDALYGYDLKQLQPEFRSQVHRRSEVLDDVAAALGSEVPRALQLSEEDVQALLQFLVSLSSPRASALDELLPAAVPSGLGLVSP